MLTDKDKEGQFIFSIPAPPDEAHKQDFKKNLRDMALSYGATWSIVEEKDGKLIWLAHFKDLADCAKMYKSMNQQVGGGLPLPKWVEEYKTH